MNICIIFFLYPKELFQHINTEKNCMFPITILLSVFSWSIFFPQGNFKQTNTDSLLYSCSRVIIGMESGIGTLSSNSN